MYSFFKAPQKWRLKIITRNYNYQILLLKFPTMISQKESSLHKVSVFSFSGLCFSEFVLNTKIYSVNYHFQSEFGKTRTRKMPNIDTFYVGLRLFLTLLKLLYKRAEKLKNFFLTSGEQIILLSRKTCSSGSIYSIVSIQQNDLAMINKAKS